MIKLEKFSVLKNTQPMVKKKRVKKRLEDGQFIYVTRKKTEENRLIINCIVFHQATNKIIVVQDIAKGKIYLPGYKITPKDVESFNTEPSNSENLLADGQLLENEKKSGLAEIKADEDSSLLNDTVKKELRFKSIKEKLKKFFVEKTDLHIDGLRLLGSFSNKQSKRLVFVEDILRLGIDTDRQYQWFRNDNSQYIAFWLSLDQAILLPDLEPILTAFVNRQKNRGKVHKLFTTITPAKNE